jgi:protein-S-isoprenylcysteine O-methyltransferase Ste14
MTLSMIRAIILLPGMALVIIPGLLLGLAAGTGLAHRPAGPAAAAFWAAAALLLLGLVLAAWTVRLQFVFGRGTPAPWDPTRKLVVLGPYRHTRNPMMTGAFLILAAEALLLRSLPIAAWLLIFVLGNLVYIPRFEERALEERFGQAYLDYKEHVPRWMPRLRPWTPSDPH